MTSTPKLKMTRDLVAEDSAISKYHQASLKKKKAPGLGPGALLALQQASAYRLTCRLVPPPGPPPMGPPAPLPLETTLTQSASLSLKYEVSLALRSASRLLCSVPEAAVVNPGSSKITHEPASISVRVRDRTAFRWSP